MSLDSEILQDLAAREAICQCLYRYCRGIDRVCADLIRSAYWPDAFDDHLEFKGSIDDFIEYAIPRLSAVDIYTHLIGNTYIEVQGNEASAESYLFSYHRVDKDGSKYDQILGGRYLDKFERRGNEWRIINRLVVEDWRRDLSDSSEMRTEKKDKDYFFPNDRSFAWLSGKAA